MAEQVCPKCRQSSFTWSVDEEALRFTQWRCRHCDYVAEEEVARGKLFRLQQAIVASLIKDSEGLQRWCAACGRFAATDEVGSL